MRTLEYSAQDYLSRPLGHECMTNDISGVMDALVFNRTMEP